MADTPDATTLYEEHRAIDMDSHAPLETDRVNVSSAERQFNELSRQLSRQMSLHSQKKASTTRSSAETAKDPEKGVEQEDLFDLREYLSSSNDAHQQAGIKHKVRRKFTE